MPGTTTLSSSSTLATIPSPLGNGLLTVNADVDVQEHGGAGPAGPGIVGHQEGLGSFLTPSTMTSSSSSHVASMRSWVVFRRTSTPILISRTATTIAITESRM